MSDPRTIKTAVSIPIGVFRKAEALTGKLAVSRSQLFTMALEDFVKQHENRQMLARINAAHDGLANADEQAYQIRMGKHHRRMVEGEW